MANLAGTPPISAGMVAIIQAGLTHMLIKNGPTAILKIIIGNMRMGSIEGKPVFI